ncbi:MAG: hypothetical protein SH856_02220 [Flavobacteriales bacterium]|nr:hypothetical protein [Flavobacteriales bacterium]
MLKFIKYYPVNWTDGMKLTREHFVSWEQAIHDSIRDGSNQRLTSYNYGLLPPIPGVERSLELEVIVDRTGLIRVVLKSCRAITPAGARIEVVNMEGTDIHTSIGQLTDEFNFQNHNGKTLYVVLSVNLFERKPFGEPIGGEQPQRFPYSIPAYSIKVVPEDQYEDVGMWHLPVAKLVVQQNAAQLIDTYIPPSSTMESHYDLARLCDETAVFLNTMEKDTGIILQKIYTRKQTTLTEIAEHLCDRMMGWFSTHIPAFRWTARENAPIYFFASLSSLARVMKNALEMRSGSGREEFINYLTDWDEFNLQQGEFEALLNDLVLLNYNHQDISDAVIKLRRVCSKMQQVFAKLAKLDFIGKEKDPGIIVTQRTAKEADKKTKSGFWKD